MTRYHIPYTIGNHLRNYYMSTTNDKLVLYYHEYIYEDDYNYDYDDYEYEYE